MSKVGEYHREQRAMRDDPRYILRNGIPRKEGKMKISDCCGSIPWNDTDICAECKEHAEFKEE